MKSIGIIGIGNLGTHLTKFLCRNKLENFLVVSDKNQKKSDRISSDYDLDQSTNQNTIETADIIFLTVKPNHIKDVCEEINEYTDNNLQINKTIVSAAAGVPVGKINEWTKRKHNIVRFMPNIPISEGDGSIVWYTKNPYMVDKKLLSEIAEGPTNIWVDNEDLVDAATVVSGCGPAYVSKFFECYVNIGTEMGFSEDEVRILMKGMFSGTSKLLQNETGYKIMKEVASKGGATEKGLEELVKKGFDKIVRDSAFSSLNRIKKITGSLD